MSENQPNPEVQQMLPKAVKGVTDLYIGDQLGAILGTRGTEQRDESWNKTAKEFPAFSEKIKELRERMKLVAETKKEYPLPIESIVRKPFMNVEDDMAQGFLGDVLFSRIIASKGRTDESLNPMYESEVMGKELGLQDGWRSAQAKEVTLEKAVSSVLQGKLRVAHQPKQ
jgi:hypothetical protein